MLKDARSCHRAFLRHMADDEESDPHLFGQPQEHGCGLPHLRDTAGGRCDLVAVHGLYGIDHHCLRLIPCHNIRDDLQIGLAQKLQVIRRAADSGSPELDLPQGFLSRDIQDPDPAAGHVAGSLQKDRGFADSRISADQDERSRDGAAAEDAVEFPEAGGKSGLLPFLNAREGDRLYAVVAASESKSRRRGGKSPFSSRTCPCGADSDGLLHHCIPGLAGGTLSRPLGRFIAAFLAKECRLSLTPCHRILHFLL